jgi:hypothetical protein
MKMVGIVSSIVAAFTKPYVVISDEVIVEPLSYRQSGRSILYQLDVRLIGRKIAQQKTSQEE